MLPTLIPQQTTVEVRPRSDRVVLLRSSAAAMPEVEAHIDELMPRHDWSDYVLGVVDVLRRRGHEVRGFDAAVRSSVPVGAGLSSSAALAVATARALRQAFRLALDDREAALIAHEAEDRFVGAHVGLMDQLVCSLGREGEALFVDTRDLSTRRVPLGRLDIDLVVIDSGIRHDHATGGYNTRRQECEEAARSLGVSSLRDLAPDADLRRLPDAQRRRVRHVVSENARVLRAIDSIESGDAEELGTILCAGHASLRDDFEVSLPQIDRLAERAQADADVYGARLTGGGFGGCVLALAKRGAAREVAERIAAAAGGGARVVVPG